MPSPSTRLPFLAAALLSLPPAAAAQGDDYPPGPDSKPRDGVPKGTLLHGSYTAAPDSVFPGTVRDYQIYLPPGHDPSQPAPLMVFQDGVLYQAPVVFDNLIAKQEIPPLVGIFIRPGVLPPARDRSLPRFNRSHEYDSVSDDYARFLVDEFLPAIRQTHGLNLSDDPNARAIAGSSSGGICAFMVAWHRPDQFRRVFTSVGTYVGIHGADRLPVLVRKFEPKPLRLHLQSGTQDNDLYCGDWWMANQTMQRALAWNGYDVSHTWGTGGHNQKHATAIFPEVLRGLWKGYPAEPVTANPRGEARWRGAEVVGPGEWTLVSGLKGDHLDVDAAGAVSVTSDPLARAVRRDGATFAAALPSPDTIAGLTLSPDQTLLYVARRGANVLESHQIQADGKPVHGQAYFQLDNLLPEPVEPLGLCVDTRGWLYVATRIGVQVCDQAGRVNFILPTPRRPTDVCFGGPDFGELHIACGDAIYRRPTLATGCASRHHPPVLPEKPRL